MLLSDLVSQRGCYFQAPITLGQVLLWMIKKNVYDYARCCSGRLGFHCVPNLRSGALFCAKVSGRTLEGKTISFPPLGSIFSRLRKSGFHILPQRNAGVQNGWKLSLYLPLFRRFRFENKERLIAGYSVAFIDNVEKNYLK